MILDLVKEYLKIYPNEQDNLKVLIDYLNTHSIEEATDWNNFEGHIVAGGFIYARNDKKFLMLYHRDLDTYLYPGGHMTIKDINPLEAAIREAKEESGINNFECINICKDKLIPLDIHIHNVPYNTRLDLPEHLHFDFRYLFTIDSIQDVKIDEEELSDYQWFDIDYLRKNTHLGSILDKIEDLLNKE